MREHTYIGLHCWSKNVIQKAGYALLNLLHGDKEHTKMYVNKLNHVLDAINQKITCLKKKDHGDSHHVSDHIHELEILKCDIDHLKDFFKLQVKIVKKSKK